MSQTLLITGGSGFVGQALMPLLVNNDCAIRVASRQATGVFDSRISAIKHYEFNLDEINADCRSMLEGVDTVIHLAARAHIQGESGLSLDKYRQTNTEGTRCLAEMAAECGVSRFIYLSSVKVHGEKSPLTATGDIHKFNELDALNPEDPYAVSKMNAENALKDICETTDMEYVILRPPLVYGPGAKANFYRLMAVVAKGYPLPFSLLTNQRSMIYVGNLVDAIRACIDNPMARNQIFLVKDVDISLPELVKEIGFNMSKRKWGRLFPMPVNVLKLAGVMTKKTPVIERLTESLLINDNKIRTGLGWSPPYSFQEGIKNTVEWFKNSIGKD